MPMPGTLSGMKDSPEQLDPVVTGSIPINTLRWLNLLGDLTHVAVAILLILLTVLVLVYACFSYAVQMPHLATVLNHGATVPTVGNHPADPFIFSSIEFLSNILFAVILLEVLHTTVIFLHDRSSQAILHAFLVVAILSIVRKLLLVGAESSLTGETGLPFVYSALGILIGIFSILMLVGALVLINRVKEPPH